MCKQLFIVLILLPTNFCDVILMQRLLPRVYQAARSSERTCTIKYSC